MSQPESKIGELCMSEDTLYQRIGGEVAINAAV
jgi:hypothetical protein